MAMGGHIEVRREDSRRRGRGGVYQGLGGLSPP